VERLLETRRVFTLIFVLGIFVLGFRNATDPDLWWHLKTGQLICEKHQLFHVDPYSYTKSGQPWVDHEWLSEIVIFSLYRLGGWGLLIAVFAALISSAFLVLYIRSPGKPYIAGAVTVWGAIASVPSWGVRPQIFTLLLASLCLLVLERSYKSKKLLWCLPLLILVWVNLHAGYAVGIAFLVIFLIGDAIDLALGQPEWPDGFGRLKLLAVALVGSVAAIPLNPYGLAMYRYPFETLHSPSMMAYIGEWQSPDFHQPRYLATLLLMLAFLVMPAISPRRLRARELLLLIATLYLGLRSVRHVPIFVLVAVPLVSSLIEARFEASGRTLSGSRTPMTAAKLALNGVLLSGFVVFGGIWIQRTIAGQVASIAKEYPVSAVDFIRERRLPGPILNHYNWGGYFIWALYPEYRVYIDGRADVYGDRFLDSFAATYYVRGRTWRAGLDDWQVRTVILPPDAPLVTALGRMPGWKTVFSDERASVVTRVP
jgi:hypothetical protein